MTQTKGVITRRMAAKKDFNITGTGGKVKQGLAITKPITISPEPVITTLIDPKVEKPPKKRKKRRKAKKNG